MDDRSTIISREELLELTSQIVQSHVSHNMISPTDLPSFIQGTYKHLERLAVGIPEEEPPTPAVPINRSSSRDRLICLECGKSMKMLRRHLSAEHDLTPSEYIEKWNLPSSYPMVAPAYSKQRSELAHRIGLGRRISAAEEIEEEVEAPKSRSRRATSSRKTSSGATNRASGDSRSSPDRSRSKSARGRTPVEDFEEDSYPDQEALVEEEEREYDASAANEDKEIREPDNHYETLDDYEETVEDYEPDDR